MQIAFFMAVFFLFSSSITICSGEWTVKTLTSSDKINEDPSVAIVNRTVHVVWSTWVDNNISAIEYRRSLDNGKTWRDTVCLTSNATNAVTSAIAAFGSTIHVVWKDYRNGNPEIYYIQSTDNGITWSTPQRLTYDDPRPTNIYDVNIVSEGPQVCLAWKDYRSGSSEIFFKRSNDSGKTWNPDQRITYDYRASYSPTIAVEGSNIYIAYDDYGTKTNVCVLASNDNGITWSEKYVTMNETSARYLMPSIAVSQNVVYLAWEDEHKGQPQIYFAKSVDGGKNYGEVQTLTTDITGSTNPKIYAFKENLTLIYQHAHGNSFDVYLISSNDGGSSWSESRPLLTGSDYYTAKIAGYEDNIHVVCQEINESGFYNILHCVNTSGNPAVNLLSALPSSILLPGSVHVTVDGYDPMYNNSEVTCIVQYSISPDEWHDANVTFNDSFWEANINFSNTSSTGDYAVRAQLSNPDGIKSSWQLGSFVVTKSEVSNPTSSTPGFEFAFVIIGIIIVFFTKRKYYDEKK